MNKKVMAGVAQLEEFNESLYHVSMVSRSDNATAETATDGADSASASASSQSKAPKPKANATGEEEDDDKYLIATSEQPICALHQKEWIEEKDLPKMYAGFSTCFRKEAGKHGKDTWGIFRVHQFDKVEQFVICAPEESWRLHEEMKETSEQFLQSLKLPYRVVNIVSGELNNAAAKKYDIEGWFPNYGEFKELMSLSNCTDYQSRAMDITYGHPKRYVHMLNATLCALTRTICCILENYQGIKVDQDGNKQQGVYIPEVLIPYMNGVDFLPFIKPARDFEGKGDKNKKETKKKETSKQATSTVSKKQAKSGTYTIGKDSYKTSVKKLIGKKFNSVEEFSKFLNQQ